MDERILPIFKSFPGDIKRIDEAIHPFRDSCRNILAEKIVSFLFHYHDGALAPQRWGFDDPPQSEVDEHAENKIVNIFSRPCVGLMLKKMGKGGLTVFLHNDYPDLPPTRGDYAWNGKERGSVSILLNRRREFNLQQWIPVMNDLCQLIGTDYGYIYELDPHCIGVRRLLATAFETPYYERINRRPEEALSVRRMITLINDYLNAELPIVGIPAKYYYPNINKDTSPLDYGLYAFNLMQDLLPLESEESFQTGLMLELNPFAPEISSSGWNLPDLFCHSSVYISKTDIISALGKTYFIGPLQNELVLPYLGFSRGYCLSERYSPHIKQILLLP